MNETKLHTIGRVEQVDLPEWNIEGIEAKIDTGAYTSSIHCHHIEEFEKDGISFVRFNILDPEHPSYNDQLVELPIFDKRDVKSSNGQTETRFFIKTKINLFKTNFTIELSLTDRSVMKFPVLIGRKFIHNKFLVDVSKKNLSKKTTERTS